MTLAEKRKADVYNKAFKDFCFKGSYLTDPDSWFLKPEDDYRDRILGVWPTTNTPKKGGEESMTKFKVGELVRYKQCSTEYKIIVHRGSDAIQHCKTKAIYTRVNWHSLEWVPIPIPKTQTPYEFKVGDRVECVKTGGVGNLRQSNHYTILSFWFEDKDKLELSESPGRFFYKNRFILANKPTTTKHNNPNQEENTMSITINETILEIFPNGKDAALVTKFVGKEYPENNHRALLDLKLNAKAILKHCQEKQKEEDNL